MESLLIKDEQGNYSLKAGVKLDDLAEMTLDAMRKDPNIDLDTARKAKSRIALALRSEKEEAFYVIFLNAKNQILDEKIMFRGTINESRVYVRPIARAALELNAAGIVVGHNHPSGNSSPSGSDIEMTKKLSKALSIFDIKVIDHILTSSGGTISLAEEQIKFN